MMTTTGRYFHNLLTTRFALTRTFPVRVLDSIERAIKASETRHGGEIGFAIETSLDLPALIHGTTARDRAIKAFSDLRIWDTAANNGVLIYILLAEKDIEIVADRGFGPCVQPSEWERVCDHLRQTFKEKQFEKGSLQAIEEVTEIIARHFPHTPGDINELPNRPAII
jgi:uncharacterized membrane protein